MAVEAPPFLVVQADQKVPVRVDDFFQHVTDSLRDQLRPGQVGHRGEDVGGAAALRGALACESGLNPPRQLRYFATTSLVMFVSF